MRLPPQGHRAAGALIPQSTARPAQRRPTPGILPGSLPPSRVECLASPATEHLRTRSAPMYPSAPALTVNTPATSAAPAADTTPTVHDRLESLITLRGIRTGRKAAARLRRRVPQRCAETRHAPVRAMHDRSRLPRFFSRFFRPVCTSEGDARPARHRSRAAVNPGIGLDVRHGQLARGDQCQAPVR